MTLVRGACAHDCPDTCAWQIRVEDGRAVELIADKEHPFTRGGLCAKVNRFLDDRVHHPDRILYPLKRTGPKGSGAFERVSWDEALADIGSRLRALVDEHGGEAVLPYSYAGTQGMLQGWTMDSRFFARLGATRLERTVCTDTAAAGLTATIGSSAALDPEAIEHSRFIVLWGTNTVVTNLHLWPFIQRARKQGATVVVIDPVRTRTARAADWHVALRPGTDAALALGLMHVIVAEGLHDADYVERHTVGFDALEQRLAEYPPERVARITGVPAEEIARLARAYATTRPAAIRTLVGMEHRRAGAGAFRAVACLPALTGAWRDRGGGLIALAGRFTRDILPMQVLDMPELEDPSVRQVNMMQIGRVLTELDPPVRALVVYNANPAATSPNQELVLRGLAREDLFTVVSELVMTDTAAHADYVLPATTQAEQLEVVYSWGTPFITLNVPAITPLGEAVPNTELFRRLARATGLGHHPELQEGDESIARRVLDSDHPWMEGITFDRLVEDGWARLRLPEDYRPFADGGFATPSGRCELFSEAMAAEGFDPLPGYDGPEGPPADGALSLVSAKPEVHFLNASYGGTPRHLRAAREPVLEISPADAAARGIADGDLVRVSNERGALEVRAHVGDVVRDGVVALPSGWWASRHPNGRSVNVLTSDGIAPHGRGGDFHDTWVEVAPVSAGTLPRA